MELREPSRHEIFKVWYSIFTTKTPKIPYLAGIESRNMQFASASFIFSCLNLSWGKISKKSRHHKSLYLPTASTFPQNDGFSSKFQKCKYIRKKFSNEKYSRLDFLSFLFPSFFATVEYLLKKAARVSSTRNKAVHHFNFCVRLLSAYHQPCGKNEKN